VAVGLSGVLVVSSNAANWSIDNAGIANDLYNVEYAGGMFLAAGNTGALETSPDGVIWTPKNTGTTLPLFCSTYWRGRYFAGGGLGTVLSSPDSVSWTTNNAGTATESVYAFLDTDEALWAVGSGGFLAASSNGVNWSPRSFTGNGVAGYSILHTNNLFMIAGGSGADFSQPNIFVSRDGTNWAGANPATNGLFLGLVFANGVYLAAGFDAHYNPLLFTSVNGTNWTARNPGTSNPLFGAGSAGGLLLAAGGVGTVLSSADGATWKVHQTGAFSDLNGVAANSQVIVTVGNSGTTMETYFQTAPQFSGSTLLPDGRFFFTTRGAAGSVIRVQANPALGGTNWQTIVVHTNVVEDASFVDDSSKTNGARFYRLVSP
jgi:hypothetical protein